MRRNQQDDTEPVPEGGHTVFTDGHASKMKFVTPPGSGGEVTKEEAAAWLATPVDPTPEARALLAAHRTAAEETK